MPPAPRRARAPPQVFLVASLVSTKPPLPYLFRTYQHDARTASRFPGDCGSRVWEALRASTAAPTFFEPVVRDRLMFQDGGLLNNNPTSLAIHEARCLWPDRPIAAIVSIGTGRSPVADSKAWSFTGATLLASATDTERTHQVVARRAALCCACAGGRAVLPRRRAR